MSERVKREDERSIGENLFSLFYLYSTQDGAYTRQVADLQRL